MINKKSISLKDMITTFNGYQGQVTKILKKGIVLDGCKIIYLKDIKSLSKPKVTKIKYLKWKVKYEIGTKKLKILYFAHMLKWKLKKVLYVK